MLPIKMAWPLLFLLMQGERQIYIWLDYNSTGKTVLIF